MEITSTQITIPETAPAAPQNLDQAYNLTAQHMHAGRADAQIEAILVAQGLTTEAAETVVSEMRGHFNKAHHEAARKDMLHGGLWLGGGLLVTGVTYSMASEGGSYFMTWGAIIFGGIQFFKGLIRYMQK